MELTVKILAWLGLGTASMLAVWTAAAWADYLIKFTARHCWESMSVFRCMCFWGGLQLSPRGRRHNPAFIAQVMHERYQRLIEESPEIGREFLRLCEQDSPAVPNERHDRSIQ